MQQEFIVRKQIDLQAEPAEVWEALTNPELTKKYFYGCKVSSKWKVGSRISWKRKFLWMKIELTGKITQIEPQKLLQYTLQNSNSEESDGIVSQSLVTDTLTYKNGITTLSVSDDVGQGEGAEKRYNKSVKGWDKILNGLKKLVEKEA